MPTASLKLVSSYEVALVGFEYAYDGSGRQSRMEEINGRIVSYGYDAKGQLFSEVSTGSSQSCLQYSSSFSYDALGNRISHEKDNVVTSYTYDNVNRMTAATTSGVTTTYIYDDNGNTLSIQEGTDPAASYAYDAENRVTAYQADGISAVYTYYPSGLRKTKTVNGVTTTYVWDGDQLVLELSGSGGVRHLRCHALLARVEFTSLTNPTTVSTVYFQHDGHGNVALKSDASGNAIRGYKYDAFGNILNPNASDTNPFRYCGEYYDAETGTYYLRARHYWSDLGRFTQEDTHWNTGNMVYGDEPVTLSRGLPGGEYSLPSVLAVMQSNNKYLYCVNNPVLYVDPHGEVALLVVTTLAGATLGGIVGAVHSYRKADKVSLRSIVTGAVAGGLSGLGLGAASSLVASAAMGGTSLTLTASQTFAGFSALMKGSTAATFWGVSKDGVNQGIRHFFDYSIDKQPRLVSIAKKLNFDLTIDKAGFERFTNAALNIVNNYEQMGGIMRVSEKKVAYFYNNVIVITYNGKLQSVMSGPLKSFNNMTGG